MVENGEIKPFFLLLRDNCVHDSRRPWMKKFREQKVIKLVIKMLDLKSPLSIEEVKSEWKMIKKNVDYLSLDKLLTLGVPDLYLRPQVRQFSFEQ